MHFSPSFSRTTFKSLHYIKYTQLSRDDPVDAGFLWGNDKKRHPVYLNTNSVQYQTQCYSSAVVTILLNHCTQMPCFVLLFHYKKCRRRSNPSSFLVVTAEALITVKQTWDGIWRARTCWTEAMLQMFQFYREIVQLQLLTCKSGCTKLESCARMRWKWRPNAANSYWGWGSHNSAILCRKWPEWCLRSAWWAKTQ